MKKKVVFSGIQPSGIIHLGNYLGAIKQWINLQDDYDCFFCIVDLHAITVEQNPKELHQNIRKLAVLYLASGLNPEKATLFVQSEVSAHAELAWILNCYTMMGELSRMTQYKEKNKKAGERVGLFDYPVLMAADILLYRTHLVPVGDDQVQHVELCRDIAERFNGAYGNIFTLPQAMLQKSGARIMGLDDPKKKMSKSASSEYNYISLLDTPSQVEKKIMRAVTDSGSDIHFDEKKKPAVSSLLSIFSLLSGESLENLESQYAQKGYGEFKRDLTLVINDFLRPLQKRFQDFYRNNTLEVILQQGKKKAEAVANTTLKEVKSLIGLG